MKVGHHMNAVSFDETPIWWHELKLIGVDAHGMKKWQGRKLYTFDLVQEWIRDGIYSTEGFITHRFPLDQYKAALKLAINPSKNLIKIGLRLNQYGPFRYSKGVIPVFCLKTPEK